MASTCVVLWSSLASVLLGNVVGRLGLSRKHMLDFECHPKFDS